jgi:hypothetical protein
MFDRLFWSISDFAEALARHYENREPGDIKVVPLRASSVYA